MYVEGHLEEGTFLFRVTSDAGREIESILTEDINETYNDWLRDYGETGYTFEIFEVTLTPRTFNILDPVPARIVLI